jgi:hypothetical protein
MSIFLREIEWGYIREIGGNWKKWGNCRKMRKLEENGEIIGK